MPVSCWISTPVRTQATLSMDGSGSVACDRTIAMGIVSRYAGRRTTEFDLRMGWRPARVISTLDGCDVECLPGLLIEDRCRLRWHLARRGPTFTLS